MTEKQQLIRDVARLTKERNQYKEVARTLFHIFRDELDVPDWLRRYPWLEVAEPQAPPENTPTKIPPRHE